MQLPKPSEFPSQIHEDLVGPELRLARALHPFEPEVLVHVLQGLEALGEVLVVQLPGKVVAVLLDQPLRADDVEARALLDDGHRRRVR